MNCCEKIQRSYKRAVKHNRMHPLTLELRDPALRQEFKKKLEERALDWIPFFLLLTFLKLIFVTVSVILGSKELRCTIVLVVQNLVVVTFFFVLTRLRPSAVTWMVPALLFAHLLTYFGFFMLEKQLPWLELENKNFRFDFLTFYCVTVLMLQVEFKHWILFWAPFFAPLAIYFSWFQGKMLEKT